MDITSEKGKESLRGVKGVAGDAPPVLIRGLSADTTMQQIGRILRREWTKIHSPKSLGAIQQMCQIEYCWETLFTVVK